MLELEGCHKSAQCGSRTSLTSWLQRVPIPLNRFSPRGLFTLVPTLLNWLSRRREKLIQEGGTVTRVIAGHFHTFSMHIFIPGQCSQMGFRKKMSQGCTTSPLSSSSPILSPFYSPSLPHPPLQWQAGHSHTAAAPTPQLRPLTPKWKKNFFFRGLAVCLPVRLSVLSGSQNPSRFWSGCWVWGVGFRKWTPSFSHPFFDPGEGALLPLDAPVPIHTPLAYGWSLVISQETPWPLLLYLSFSGKAKGGGGPYSSSNLTLGRLLLPCSAPLPESLVFYNVQK